WGPFLKRCPRCGFDENPDAQESCIICNTSLATAVVVHAKRIVLIWGVVLFCVGIGVMGVGLSWMWNWGGGLAAAVASLAGLLLASYEAGLYRGGHQKLWRTERRPVQDAQATA